MSEADAIRALMEADRWIDRVTSQRNHLPEKDELVAVERDLRASLRAIQETQASLDPVKLAFDDAEREAERLRKRESELARTLAASTANARELEALQKEVVHVRALLAESEDRELELLLALEPLEETIARLRADAQPQVVRRGKLQEEIVSLEASLDDELVSLATNREERAAALSPELLTRYTAALAHAGTSGAAQIDGGKCDGCRIALSPLDLDRWKTRPEGTFMACPECGRLLLP
jgi:predicted  nucleic acid-binding Zn-ribbon protein